MRTFRAIIGILLASACLADTKTTQAQDAVAADYGELQVLNDYRDRDQKLGHVSMGPITRIAGTYFDRKDSWASDSGFNWLIESAPQFQFHVDGGAGSHSNNETNLIAQWSLVDKANSKAGKPACLVPVLLYLGQPDDF